VVGSRFDADTRRLLEVFARNRLSSRWLDATLRLTLLKGASSTPTFSVPAGAVSSKDSQGYFATMGIDADLMTGARLATRAMITKLQNDHGLSAADAYILCSIAGDLRILEIVDAGIWNVAMTMPLEVFR
jgi:acetamidase/formamidase